MPWAIIDKETELSDINYKFGGISTGGIFKGKVSVYGICSQKFASKVSWDAVPTELQKGLYVKDSSIIIEDDVSISNSSGHAIELDNSTLTIEDVKGTATGGWGVYAHDGSKVFLKNAVPTISGDQGVAGDITIDNSVDATTWATVWSGTPKVETTSDLIVIKKK